MHQGGCNPKGLSKRLTPQLRTVRKMRELGERHELPYEIRLDLPVEVYARVRGTCSPSRSFRELVHLSAFLFA